MCLSPSINVIISNLKPKNASNHGQVTGPLGFHPFSIAHDALCFVKEARNAYVRNNAGFSMPEDILCSPIPRGNF